MGMGSFVLVCHHKIILWSCIRPPKFRSNFATTSLCLTVLVVFSKDIDECASSSQSLCGENAQCSDTDGSFVCLCNEGYSESGGLCTGM